MKASITIAWVTGILIILAVLFPPFGYTHTSFHIIHYGSNVPDYEAKNVVPWTYVTHRFIFSKPPMHDPRLTGDATHTKDRDVYTTADNICISWPILGIEVLMIVLVAGVLALTVESRRRHGIA